jgi:hypothetical protein
VQALQRAILVVLCLLAACRTPSMGNVFAQKSRGEGAVRVYPIDPKQAWDIAVHVYRWEGAGTIEEHRDDGFMLTTIFRPYSGSQGGQTTYTGAWIEPAPGGTKVTCVADGLGLTQDRFHDRFAQALALVQQGKPLPSEAPPPPAEQLPRCERDSDCILGVCVEGRCRR